MAEHKAKKGSRTYLTWTDAMDLALLEVLVEHHNNGDRGQNGWKPHVYNAAIRNAKEKCNVDITKENISSRCKTFDKHYEIISKILSQSGFGWDWENNRFSMDSEDVWDRYVEANKGAACYKTKVVKNWDSICAIYSKDHANGEDGNDDSPPMLAPKKQRTGDAIVGMLTEMKTSFQEAMQSNAPIELPKKIAPSIIFAALKEIPDLARGDMLRSYGMLLSRDDRIFEALMELPMEMRKDWLLFENDRK
ncbi:hypothetical protein BS78_07G147400 [Paspalum vaginatum]|nr:hypothetical protein BS78_07G147400 [Paspalum vaginatum]